MLECDYPIPHASEGQSVTMAGLRAALSGAQFRLSMTRATHRTACRPVPALCRHCADPAAAEMGAGRPSPLNTACPPPGMARHSPATRQWELVCHWEPGQGEPVTAGTSVSCVRSEQECLMSSRLTPCDATAAEAVSVSVPMSASV